MVSWWKSKNKSISSIETDSEGEFMSLNSENFNADLLISKPSKFYIRSRQHLDSRKRKMKPTQTILDGIYGNVLKYKFGNLNDEFVHYMAYSIMHDKVFMDLSYGFVRQHSEDLQSAKISIKQHHINVLKSRKREAIMAERDLKIKIQGRKHKKKKKKSASKDYDKPDINFNNNSSRLTANKHENNEYKINFEVEDNQSVDSLNDFKLEKASLTKFIKNDEGYEISEDGLFIEFPKASKTRSYIKLLLRHKSLVKDVDYKFSPNEMDAIFSKYHHELNDLDWTHLQYISLGLRSSLDEKF